MVEAVLDYARENNFTQIIIAKSRQSSLWELVFGSVTQRLICRGRDVNIQVIAEPAAVRSGRTQEVKKGQAYRDRPGAQAYMASLLWVATGLGVGLGLRTFLAVSNIALVFLPAILAVAIGYGLFPSLLACLLSLLAFNFFFLPPLYTFTIADPENVVALFFFGVVALIASNLAARTRDQALAARQRARTTEELYLFSRKLAGAVTLDDVLWATAHQIALMLKVKVVLLLPDAVALTVRAGFPPEDQLDAADLRRRSGARSTTARQGAGPTPCPERNGCSCRCRPGAGRSGSSASTGTSPGHCSPLNNTGCWARSPTMRLWRLSG